MDYEKSLSVPSLVIHQHQHKKTEQQHITNIIDNRTDTIPTCFLIHPCDIHVDGCHFQRFLPVMAGINIQISA